MTPTPSSPGAHTPTPWQLQTSPDMRRPHLIHGQYGAIARVERKGGDAAFIVRAVNAHDDLVAALRDLRTTLLADDMNGTLSRASRKRAVGIVKDALAKAEGR